MATIYLVRHGEKEQQIGDPALTATGHRQAQLTGIYLTQFPINQIVASPYLRTQQTAQHIAEKLKLPVKSSELLKERANWGDDPNQTMAEFFTMWNHATWHRDFQPPVGDSSSAAGKRIEQALATFTNPENHGGDQHLLLVTHGGVIADFLRNVFGEAELASLVRQFPNGQGHEIKECSVTIIQNHLDQFKLVELASHTHLIQ